MHKSEIEAVCWAALESVARKECRRDALTAGGQYDVTLRISGEVRAKPFACEATAHVVVNHDGVRVVSQAPPPSHLIGYLLGQLSQAKRERMLRTLPESFANAANRLPDVDAGLVEAAANLLDRLRARVQQQVRGAISTSYSVHNLT
jgi:hypothetical protein